MYNALHVLDKEQFSFDDIWLPLDDLLYEPIYGWFIF
jgi:hypothetical protein